MKLAQELTAHSTALPPRGPEFLTAAERSERCRQLAKLGYLVARVVDVVSTTSDAPQPANPPVRTLLTPQEQGARIRVTVWVSVLPLPVTSVTVSRTANVPAAKVWSTTRPFELLPSPKSQSNEHVSQTTPSSVDVLASKTTLAPATGLSGTKVNAGVGYVSFEGPRIPTATDFEL